MARNPENVLRGPAVFYHAPVGTPFPATPATPPAVEWQQFGYTDEGVNTTTSVTNEAIRVEEEVMALDFDITQRDVTIQAMINEMTLENFVAVFGGEIDSDTPGVRSWDMPRGAATTRRALLLRGSAPGDQVWGSSRDIRVPAATSLGGLEIPQRKGQKQGIAVEFGVALPASGPAISWVDLSNESA